MNDTGLIFSLYGFTVIMGMLLGLGGIANVAIEIPTSYAAEGTETTTQSVPVNFLECVFSTLNPFQSWDRTDEVCSRDVTQKTFQVFTNILTFAFSLGVFFFQMLTIQLPIPGWLNTMILLPAAIATIFVGLKFARGTA